MVNFGHVCRHLCSNPCAARPAASSRLQVKSLVPGGAAEKSCAVDIGHQIIAIGDRDVSSATLEEVAVMLRGPVGSEINLKFLETREVKLNMERCVFMNDGTPSVGIKWKDGKINTDAGFAAALSTEESQKR
jgi:hypothetical protein